MILNNKVILVTGSSGFIGSHLIEALATMGAHAIGMDRKNNYNANTDYRNVKFIEWDITKPLDIPLCKIDWAFHVAAITDICLCEKNPEMAHLVNAQGVLNVLEYCARCKVDRFVYISTLGVYGNPIYLPIDENHPVNPMNIYTDSKLKGEKMVSSFDSEQGMILSIARSFNVYGPWQNESMVIPKIIKQALINDKINMQNIDTSRDFIYVTDVVKGLIKIALKGTNTIYNLGTGKEIFIRDLIKIISSILKKSITVISENHSENSVKHSQADISKSRKELVWEPEISIEEGLIKTIDYYQKLYKREE